MTIREQNEIVIIYSENEVPEVLKKIEAFKADGFKIYQFTVAKNKERGFYRMDKQSVEITDI
jgi:hypothetical protein